MSPARLITRCVMTLALAASPALALDGPTSATSTTVPIAYRALGGVLDGAQALSFLDVSLVTPASATAPGEPILPPEAGDLDGPFEVAGGRALLLAGGTLWDAARGSALVEPGEEDGPFTGLALGPRGGVALVAGDELGVVSGGAFLPLVELPGAGFEVAALPDGTLVLWRRGEAGSTILLVREARTAVLARIEAPIDAVAASGRRVLVAAGGVLYAAAPGEATAILHAGLPAGEVDGLAADAAAGTVFVSARGAVHVLLGGSLLPLVDGVSGAVRCAVEGGRLVVYVLDRERRALVRLVGAGRIGGR